MIKSNIKYTNQAILYRRFGAWLSGLCAIHCIALPVAIIFLPFVEPYLHFNWAVEMLVYASILIIGGGFLWQDYQKHANKIPLVLFTVGFALLLMAHFISYPIAHFTSLVVGGALLSFGQMYNIRLHKINCTGSAK